VQLVAALRRISDPDDHVPKLGDAGELAALRWCRAVRIRVVVVRGIGLQLAQQRLYGKIQDMQDTSGVLLSLIKGDAAFTTCALEEG
jgi:hypothetical protein